MAEARDADAPMTQRDTFVVGLTTSSGTHYRVVWDASNVRGTLIRTPTLHPDHPMSGPLRRDNKAVPLLGFTRIALGEPVTFLVSVRDDAVTTVRRANTVVEFRGVTVG